MPGRKAETELNLRQLRLVHISSGTDQMMNYPDQQKKKSCYNSQTGFQNILFKDCQDDKESGHCRPHNPESQFRLVYL